MLLRDRGVNTVNQANLLAQLGSPAITPDLAEALNRLSGLGQWRGAHLNAAGMGERNAVVILSNSGSWVAEFREVGVRIGHAIVVDGLRDDDTLSIRDPYDGTSYRMKLDVFLTYWTWAAVWQERP
jgi:filamentous hemagglutinin